MNKVTSPVVNGREGLERVAEDVEAAEGSHSLGHVLRVQRVDEAEQRTQRPVRDADLEMKVANI